jgi:rhamnose utilization protein RhaD (predicted bifunctional aldolase and dehydrogenase)/NAD(P)-dependent dehydrogenase (short-subunit alcohol dehydrogenase family)
MTTATASPSPVLHFLEDRWDPSVAAGLDEPELLRYRSNLLGSDLRITNFAGGNTSSKVWETDPLTGQRVEVLWVKGSGGDLGSIKRSGFAALYMDKLLALERVYKGVEAEDDMVAMYPLCAFRNNPVAASIDTPLHGFLPFPHVDHLHPDWGIALAASANGKEKMEEFNREFGHSLLWLPWQRPGFELAMMMRRAVEENPGCDGIVLGGHGLFTWGQTQRECYMNTLSVIDQLGQFIERHGRGKVRFGGQAVPARVDRRADAIQIAPFLRGRISAQQRFISNFNDRPDVLQFVDSVNGKELAFLGTSCPDHFIRTKIRPMFVPWGADEDLQALQKSIDASLAQYREQYRAYYRAFASDDSPAIRDASPTVVLIPGMGMFSYGKNKTEARITGEFYTNAIHVMEGASMLGDGQVTGPVPHHPTDEDLSLHPNGQRSPAGDPVSVGTPVPQCQPGMDPASFRSFSNYVALPAIEAFRIEYWAMEEAKIRRQPPEKELSRRVALVIGGASGIGREVARLAATRGAHVFVSDRNDAGAAQVADELGSLTSREFTGSSGVDIRSRDSIREMLGEAALAFGGIDILINTAALFPASPTGEIPDEMWGDTLAINVTANYLLADEAAKMFEEQGLHGNIVFTSSANAVVAKRGSEAYDVSKAALSHLIRELAVSMAPNVRVNGISPATVVKGSTMFPRDRLRASLKKYNIPFQESFSDEELRSRLAAFYAERTLTNKMIDPADCAEAILFLASPRARCTTGHVIPVDGGLTEAFQR